MSHVTREGNNKRIEVVTKSHFGETKTTTEDIYNTFDDLILFVLEKLGYELIADMEADGVVFQRAMDTIIYPTPDLTTTYKLV